MTNISEIRDSYRNGASLSKSEMKKLYEAAKEAYYNGEQILEDFEFDTLEESLGLENKAYVGTHHNPSYTIPHPLIMGSLSKVQIHKGKEGNVDWTKYLADVCKYIKRNGARKFIVTPKFDGCSFEAVIDNTDGSQAIDSISTRGDGEYGRDISAHIINKVRKNAILPINGKYILRGEVLVKKSVFEEKYAEEFSNPRSFVAGMLGRDYDNDIIDQLHDLSIIIYDVRVNNGAWFESDWSKYSLPDTPKMFYSEATFDSVTDLIGTYTAFAEYREKCEFALDGIVIKPLESDRENNNTETRPKDCVAIKFIPMLQETEVVKIEWNLKKFGNLVPLIYVRPVEMDGKIIQKCSGSNYQNLINKKVSVGTKVVVSLAGDIIPFLYKVTDTTAFDESKLCIPEEYDTYIDGVNLKAALTPEEVNRCLFINSATSLNIDNIGPATATAIYDYLLKARVNDATSEFFGEDNSIKVIPNNILLCSPEDIYFGAGAGKNATNCRSSFEKFVREISLTQIIKSCSFKHCGKKVAEQIEKYLVNGPDAADFNHLPTEGYNWAFSNGSANMIQLNFILSYLGKSFDDFKERIAEAAAIASDQIPVILTGEPNDYLSKGQFLQAHPEYRMTGSWKEVKIVFTNSLESNTGKMKKAKEKGIEICLY